MSNYCDNREKEDNEKDKTWEKESNSMADYPFLGFGCLSGEFLLLIIGIVKFIPALIFFSLFLLTIGNLVILLIGMAQSCSILSKAKRYEIPDNDEKVIRAKANIAASTIGLVSITSKTIKTTKNTVTDVADPDKWHLEV